MSQKLSRTINLPKAPASFSDDQKRYMDDFARSLIGHFRDMFDLLGEDAGAMEKHLGDKTAHFMDEGNVAGVGVLRGTDGKIRFASADGTEESDDYGITAGFVSPALEHVGLNTGVHGATATPLAGRIPLFSSDGRLKGGAPVDANDLVTKQFLSDQIAENKMTPVLYCWGCSATAANMPVEWYHREEDRTVQYDGTNITLAAGKYLLAVNFPGFSFIVESTDQVLLRLTAINCITQLIVLGAETTIYVRLNSATAENEPDVQRSPSITIISV